MSEPLTREDELRRRLAHADHCIRANNEMSAQVMVELRTIAAERDALREKLERMAYSPSICECLAAISADSDRRIEQIHGEYAAEMVRRTKYESVLVRNALASQRAAEREDEGDAPDSITLRLEAARADERRKVAEGIVRECQNEHAGAYKNEVEWNDEKVFDWLERFIRENGGE